MFKKFVYWLADVIDDLWVTIFGQAKQTRNLNLFQHIIRERLPHDPKYEIVKGTWGKRTLFALYDKNGKPYDVDCILVNNKFVVIDEKDGHSRKYIIL